MRLLLLLLLLLLFRSRVAYSLLDASFVLAFKKIITDDPTHALDSWRFNSPSFPCDWLGVECDTKFYPTGFPIVRGISLPDKKLAGILSDWTQLSGLAFLRTLNLSRNRFRGEIPGFISDCKVLVTLDLSYNFFTGKPPSFAKLSQLTTLVLHHNKLEGDFPGAICDAQSLRNVDMRNNRMQGVISDDISKCSTLEILKLSRNALHGTLPPTLAQLTRLRVLDLSHNTLSGDLPEAVGQLTYMSQLIVSYNSLTGFITPSIGAAKYLVLLHLRNNQIGGTIPDSIGGLTFLEELSLSKNKLQGSIPQVISNLAARLTSLEMSHNMLTGSIPSSLGNMTRLQNLDLSHNLLSGALPQFTEAASSLNTFDLSSNYLKGSVPASIFSLSSLQYLNLANNSLSGDLPLEMGDLGMLIVMDLSKNNFTGAIPDTFGSSLVSLMFFNGSYNQFTGNLPPGVENLTKLSVFDVSHNDLSGSLLDVPLFRRFLESGYLANNSGLCGPLLNVSCPENYGFYSFLMSKEDQAKFLPFLIVSSVGVIILVTMMAALFLKNVRPKLFEELVEFCDIRISSLMHCCGKSRRLSYEDIQSATENFCSANVIASGSRCKVYLGDFPLKGNLVVKVLNSELMKETRPHFLRECRILRNIDHNNVMQILDWCYRPELLATIYDYMARGSLHDNLFGRMRTADLNWDDRLRIAADVAVGLAFLHEQGKEERSVVCQICPQNILLDETCTAKIAGLRAIRRTDPVAAMADGGAPDRHHLSNSQDYMDYVAPESASEGEISAQGEVYSYGLTVLELITRKRATTGSLPDMLRALFPDKVKQHVDAGVLQTTTDFNQVLALMEVGLSCTEADPVLRPNMETVVSILTRIKEA